MSKFKNTRRGWLMASAASTTALMLAATGGALAQDDGDEAEVITVTGFRAAIESAIEVKREESSIVEAISAEDIGKLPDNSIAEALARLPGLTAQRLRGRAQVISVRGLGPEFSTALLNGREQVTAGDNRGVEFDQYPSELLNQVVVYKTPDASLVGQGLAGTADLRTVRPLDADPVQALSARYEWNEYGALNAGSADDGYRVTGFLVDQFANDTVGIALGFALQSSPTQSERWDAWGYPDVGGDLVLGGAKPYVESRELERTAFVGTLEFEPSAEHHTTIDAFYSRFEDVGILRGIEFPLQWSNASLDPGYTVENGLITAGSFSNVRGVVRNDTRFREADVFSFGINHQWSINDHWTLEGDLAFSSVERDDTDLETYAGTGSGNTTGAADVLGFSLAGGGNFIFSSGLDYADPNLMLLTDPQGWGQVGFIKQPQTEDELTSFRLSAERALDTGWLSSIEGGIYYSDREKTKDSVEAFVDLATPGATNTAAIPSNLLLSPTSLDFLGIGGVVSYDPIAMLNSGVYALRPLRNGDVSAKAWSVNETVTTAYVQANIDSNWGDVPVRGNFGVQVVNTDQSSTGPVNIGGAEVGVYTDGDEYTEVLPSMNLSFEVGENTFLRLGAARTMMRARMDDLRASQAVGNVNATVCTPGGLVGYDLANSRTCFSSGGGNPQLRPYFANAFDVSFEHYFADGGGYVSLAGFYKDITDWVFGSQTTVVDFGSSAAASLDALYGPGYAAANPDALIGTRSEPANTTGGYLQGLEFATNIPGDVIDPALADFGVNFSYSYTDSEIEPAPGVITPIPGLSETVGNLTVYYENEAGFSARVSNRWRSEFLGELIGFGANREFRDVSEESIIDAQIGYEFSGGMFDGLSVYLQGNNLTDEEFTTALNSDPRQVKDYQRYGATYLLGISWRR